MSDLYADTSPTEPSGPPEESNAAAAPSASPGQMGRIEEIVVRDNARRKRAFYILSILLCITVALAFLVLAFGRNEQIALESSAQRIVEDTINKQAPDLVNNAVNEKLSPIINEQLPPLVTRSVNDSVDALLAEKVDDRVDDYVAPKFESLKSQLFPYATSQPANIISEPSFFTAAETKKIKDVFKNDLPKQSMEIRQLSGQVSELVAASNAAGGSRWSEDKEQVLDRIRSLENRMKETQGTLGNFSAKLDSISTRIAQLEGIKGPCVETPIASTDSNFLTYTVKENSETNLYDLGLRIVLEGQKKTHIRGVTIYRGEKKIYGPTPMTMGVYITFSDEKHLYGIIPVFIVNRFLANEYIGFAISTAPKKCPPELG